MKTKNNVQKTILRSAAVVVSFVLISYTVSAQEFWKKLLTNSSFNEIAIAMVETSDKTKKSAPSETSDVTLANRNEVYEPELKLEYWMTNESYFGNSAIRVENETEKALEMEDWMLDENLFGGEEEAEQPLELEAWMTADKFGES